MTSQKEIGESLISNGEDEYFFRPSFAAMSRIGEPQEIVQAFCDLDNDDITPLIARAMDANGFIPARLMPHLNRKQMGKPAIMAAMSVLAACCESKVYRLNGEIIPGKSGKWAFMYRAGLLNAVEMVLIAQSLITHGIIGKAKVWQLQRHESAQATTEFRSFDYISAARNHFGMSRIDAEQLTMAEFQLLLSAKYPDQKGFTRDEDDAVADDYLAKMARRLAKV